MVYVNVLVNGQFERTPNIMIGDAAVRLENPNSISYLFPAFLFLFDHVYMPSLSRWFTYRTILLQL